jgi:ankyrin repeat protein
MKTEEIDSLNLDPEDDLSIHRFMNTTDFSDEIMKYKLMNGLNPNRVYKKGLTLLMSAAFCARPELVKILYAYGARMNMKNDAGETAFMYAKANVIKFFASHCENINEKGTNGFTKLMQYVSMGDEGVVKLLIEHKADVNIQNNAKETALFLACKYGHIKIIEMLLKAGADKEIRNFEGKTVLMKAVDDEKLEIVKILVGASANINVLNQFGETLLFRAVMGNDLAIAEFLLENGIDKNAVSKSGQTASKHSDSEEMDALLQEYT